MSRRIVAVWRISLFAAVLAGTATAAHAQEPAPAEGATREAVIEQEQAEKVKTLHPYVPARAEAIMNQAEDILQQGGLRWHPFFESAYSGGGFTLGVGYARFVSPLQHHRRARQLHDHRTTSASRSSSSRRVCSTAAARCRCSAAGARRRRSASTASARTRRRTTARTTTSSSRTPRRCSRSVPDAPRADAARRRRVLAVVAAARRGQLPLGRDRLHAGDAARSRRRARPTCTRRAPSASTGARRPATRGAAASTASPLHDYNDSDKAFGFQQVDYEAIQHIPILREAWVHLASRAASRRHSTRTVSRSRSSCCRRSAAARRCAASAAGASAIRTACCCRPSGASWSTASSTPRSSTTPAR